MLLDERFNESEDRPDVKSAIRFLSIGNVRIQLADLGFQQRHVVNEKMRHTMQFYEPAIKLHSPEDTRIGGVSLTCFSSEVYSWARVAQNDLD